MSSEIVLSLQAKEGNPRNSEGSFVTLKDGRILFAYSRHRGKDDWSDHATTDIAARLSSDSGRTWSAKDQKKGVVSSRACRGISCLIDALRDPSTSSG